MVKKKAAARKKSAGRKKSASKRTVARPTKKKSARTAVRKRKTVAGRRPAAKRSAARGSKAGGAGKSVRGKTIGLGRRVRDLDLDTLEPLDERGLGLESGGQAGDTEGLSRAELAAPERAGEGGLRTWRTPGLSPIEKSSTSVPSAASDWARTPDGPKRRSSPRISGT